MMSTWIESCSADSRGLPDETFAGKRGMTPRLPGLLVWRLLRRGARAALNVKVRIWPTPRWEERRHERPTSRRVWRCSRKWDSRVRRRVLPWRGVTATRRLPYLSSRRNDKLARRRSCLLLGYLSRELVYLLACSSPPRVVCYSNVRCCRKICIGWIWGGGLFCGLLGRRHWAESTVG